MGTMTKTSESITEHAFKGNVSQFEITSDLLRNLYKFNLTPATKLVLLELTTHLNESKNGSVVFPSVGYIAEVLGIGLTACKKAINDLIKEGIIIKTKRNNVKGNYNKYLFTSKISGLKKENMNILSQQDIKMRNSTSKWAQNEFFKQSDSDLFMNRTNNIEQINNKEDEILKFYAIKHGAKSVNSYVNVLKKNGSATKILQEHKAKENIKKRALRSIEETQSLIRNFGSMKKNCVTAAECGCSLKDILKRIKK